MCPAIFSEIAGLSVFGQKICLLQLVQLKRLIRPAPFVPFEVKGVFWVGVGDISVAGMLCEVELVAEERPHPAQQQDAVVPVHHRELVLGISRMEKITLLG